MNGTPQSPSEGFPVQPQDVAARLEQVDERVRQLCRDYPLAMLGGAALVGYVLARIVSR